MDRLRAYRWAGNVRDIKRRVLGGNKSGGTEMRGRVAHGGIGEGDLGFLCMLCQAVSGRSPGLVAVRRWPPYPRERLCGSAGGGRE